MSFLEKVKNGVNKIRDEKGVPISISQQMIHELIKKTDKVKETSVVIAEDGITITGKTEVEKLMIKKDISFLIKLLPVKMENREIHFKIEKFKPLNLNFLNKKIFHNPPFLSYDGNLIKMDVNGWEKVKKVPFGNIKNYELTDGKITLSIGI
ncbi:hypothetical protein [Neobacillus dielmonensis]|uniref:hypothetical protein n=1 Tax=Neobacillus dielmonensis TaxID=1347369 RepID=UPI0005A92D6B|nr:hypothetical protein [Neobacillus dielmonensis]